MQQRIALFLVPAVALVGALAATAQVAAPNIPAPDTAALGDSVNLQRVLAEAQAAGLAAERRAARYEAAARDADAAADATIRQAAALAARIQQAEAGIAASEARASLIERERAALRDRLAEQQQPLIRLTAALQQMSRRPTALALLKPGSLHEAVYLRATLDALLPEIARRTASLRADLRRSEALQEQASANAAALRATQRQLAERRQALAVVESRQRLLAREAGSLAARESDKVLALAEQARDLSGLVGELDAAARRRTALAALPGPVLRPPQPGAVTIAPSPGEAVPSPTRLSGFTLPLAGSVVAGFGVERPGQPRSRGLTIAARAGAQVVAPAAGRVAFAGNYRGYGEIVIIEHGGGWTSLITGLARLDVSLGQRLVAGSPLGATGSGQPRIMLELRKDGEAVNPLDQLGA